ncbi:DUF3445 domain-containing protein [Pseudorhodobacter sp.]|uniref:heme-dependent oxidative N-demethylase family protein n=1 Tax=Pseudorhodobacter sp. TaxID=1934400 RepID=UPI0034641EBC
MPLPGTLPLNEDWLLVDEAFAGQMAERDRLLAEGAPVHGMTDIATDAARETYDIVLEKLARSAAYRVSADAVTRPDGVTVTLNRTAPLLTLGRLIQQDLCLMLPDGQGEHLLAGAILCFPASWTLAEKLGQPMSRIHVPVPKYDANITRRVQRLLDGLQPDRPIWRMNHNLYAKPDLFHPRTAAAPRSDAVPHYLRAEHQCLIRLPKTRAVLFTIHTYVLPLTALPPEAIASLKTAHNP